MDTVLESRYLQKNHLLPNLLVTTRCGYIYKYSLHIQGTQHTEHKHAMFYEES
jgi:hypothetical protein